MQDNIINAVLLSDKLYANKMMCLQRGDTHVYTGRRDGTNRRLFLHDGNIFDGQGTLIISASMVDLDEGLPITRSYEKELEAFGGIPSPDWDFLNWIYGKDGKPRGKRWKNKINGEIQSSHFAQKDKFRAPRHLACHQTDCTNPGTKQCTKCKHVRYCSRTCQIKDWKNGHRELCSHLKIEFEIFILLKE